MRRIDNLLEQSRAFNDVFFVVQFFLPIRSSENVRCQSA